MRSRRVLFDEDARNRKVVRRCADEIGQGIDAAPTGAFVPAHAETAATLAGLPSGCRQIVRAP
jgi:hypothetical protein